LFFDTEVSITTAAIKNSCVYVYLTEYIQNTPSCTQNECLQDI
jgi:hypothetical protein